MKSKRSKACDISPKVKQRVWERDGGRCIICGCRTAMPNAHFIPRSQGGLGIEENIVTLCSGLSENNCHYRFDFGYGEETEQIAKQIESYLKSKYPNWKKENLIYKR